MRYERADLTTGVTAANTALEVRAGANNPVFIKEIGIFLEAATATKLGLGRPANNGSVAGGTLGAFQSDSEDDAASQGGVVLSGWSTAPTVPTTFMRMVTLPNAIGNGIVWTFAGDGLRVKAARSIVLWNIATSSALRYYIVIEE